MTDAYSYIRFSTAEQAAGDSWRRQNEAMKKFVLEHNLTLRESAAFQDLGVAAFRGANIRQGLGKFIAEVDAGTVQRGSYLIVESIDRLTRQKVVDALQLLMSLIEKGIKVVTLNDAGVQVLDKEANFGTLVITLGTMFRAHDESAKKSLRGKEVWAQKKANAANEPVTSRCPEWLEYNKATKKYELIPTRVATIQKIFELADEGVGRHRIVKFLNRNGYQSFRNVANGWQHSSVGKLLTNRSLIGYYQSFSGYHDPDTGKKSRVPEGPEHAGYYPVAIDVDLFRRVATQKYTRAIPLRGRQGPALSNLFTGMAFCMWCGAPMSMCNKGRPPSGGRYLVCSKAVRGKGCPYRSWVYEDFEMLVLVKLREVDLSAVLGDASSGEDLAAVRSEIALRYEQLQDCKLILSNLGESVAPLHGKLPAGLVATWKAEEEREGVLSRELDELRAREYAVISRVEDPATFADQLLQLYEAMDSSDVDQNYLVRVRLRDRLALIIERIVVRPLSKGEPRMVDGVPRDRLISIRFRNGMRRTIVPIGASGSSFDTSKPAGPVPPAELA